MDQSDAARDARREANAAIAKSISKKLLSGGRLTKDERATAGQILSAVAELIGEKPLTDYTRETFWSMFDISIDVRTNFLLGEAWGDTKDGAL